jgi:hypothetical protein
MIEHKAFPLVTSSREVIAMSDALECIAAAEKTLREVSSHPRDLSQVVVDAKALEEVEIMLLRLPNRQMDISGQDGKAQTEEEVAVSVSLAKQIKPLIAQVRAATVSAEEIFQSLTKFPNPDHARRLFVGALKSEATISHANEVLITSSSEDAGKISIPAKNPQNLKIRLIKLDSEKNNVVAQLVGINSASEIFAATDIGYKTVSVDVVDSSHFFLLHQASALKMPVDVTAVLDLAISGKGYGYSGSLVSIKDASQLAIRLQTLMTERVKSLFE